ncbi:uncharacterized protein LOC118410740 [Branchiostoma floridae]|uniref:Uncharacterized protein LOC118410740 n=1 Tax=Branchiostoma floridae TaxID=7739 RepID=A0A9J7KR69_BRAFL|nr:uncharacterized protein LOC118410740 [Branchiostoma floridae]
MADNRRSQSIKSLGRQSTPGLLNFNPDNWNQSSNNQKTQDNPAFRDDEEAGSAGTTESQQEESPSSMEQGVNNGQTSDPKPLPCKNIIVIVLSLLFCFIGCINYIGSIGLEVLCMWDLNLGRSMANSVAGMHTNQTWSRINDTCDPAKSQEDIPYDLIDLVLYIQPAIVVIFWKFKLAKHVDEYEGGYGTDKQEKNYRLRRTCYFISLNWLFLFLFHCVECTSCSFLNPNVVFGTAIEIINKTACPWISIAFQMTLVPVYSLCCWYATNMACVLRRRAKKIKEKSEQLFGTDNQTKDPRAILKELYTELLYDTWGEKVWKNISFVMNIMMYIAVILCLLYTHVYISEVELTLGAWFSHFMRLLTIASLALTPYMHVAFACVRVTEAFKKMSEKSIEAERQDYHTDSKYNDHIADYESRDSGHVDMGDIAVQCGIPSEREKRADRIKNRVQVTKAMKARRNDLTFEDSHTNQSAKSEEVKIAIEIKEIVQSSERRAQWARLIKEIAKAQDTVLYNGILSSLYTTRNGVHWTMLGMVGAVAWEVLDHLNAFDESKVSDTSKERFMVALFGALALAAGMSGVLFVLFWQICGCCGCGNVPFKKTCCTNLSYKTGETDKTKTKICLVAFATLILWSTIYTCFYFAVSEDNDCTMELNPLVT